MYIPHTFIAAVIFLILSLLIWGTWPNTLKFFQGRFEFYYWDFVIGGFVMSIVLGCTMGPFWSFDISFWKDFYVDHVKHIVRAFGSGVIFNVANFLLLGSASVCGISYAFLLCYGSSLVVDSLLRFLILPKESPVVLFIGNLFAILALILTSIAYRRSSTRLMFFKRGSTIALVGGLLLGLFYPLLKKALHVQGVSRLNPYTAIVIFSVGILVSNFLVNLILMKRPLFGHSLVISDYFRTKFRSHLPGFLGGALWCLGLTFRLISVNSTKGVLGYISLQGAAFITALWGIYLWKEITSKENPVHRLVGASLISYSLALVLIGVDKWFRGAL